MANLSGHQTFSFYPIDLVEEEPELADLLSNPVAASQKTFAFIEEPSSPRLTKRKTGIVAFSLNVADTKQQPREKRSGHLSPGSGHIGATLTSPRRQVVRLPDPSSLPPSIPALTVISTKDLKVELGTDLLYNTRIIW